MSFQLLFFFFFQNIVIALVQSLIARANDSTYFIYTQPGHEHRMSESQERGLSSVPLALLISR